MRSKMLTRLLVAALTITLITTACSSGQPAASVPGVSADKVKIGYIGDMSGPIVPSTIPFLKGWDTYIKMVNDEGGINGRKIEFIPEDDKYQVPMTQAAYKKLTTQDNVFAIAGPQGSDQVTAILPNSEKEGVITFGPMNSIVFQIDPFKQWHFTHLASYVDQAKVLVDYALSEIKKKGEQPRVAIVVLEVTSGKEVAGYVEDALKKAGTQSVAQVLVPSTATDATAQVQQLKSANPNYIIFHAAVAPIIVLLKAMEKASYKVPIAATYSVLSDSVYKSVGQDYGSLLVAAHSFMPADSPGPAFDAMRQAAQKYGNQQYTNNTFFTMGYAGAVTFFEGMKRAGKDLTRDSMRKGLESLKNFDTGLSAPVTYSDSSHHGITGMRMFKYDYNQQKILPFSDWMAPAK